MNQRHLNTLLKTGAYLQQYKSICVSVSGGSDSDIIIDLVERAKTNDSGDIYYIFANTGLEFQATKDHIKYLEGRYDVKISEVRGMPIPLVVKRYGVPIASKILSKNLDYYVRSCPCGLAMYNHTGRYSNNESYAFNDKIKKLADYLKENNIKTSAKCCDLSKKKPLSDFEKTVNCDLVITGERKSEGGG